MKKLFLMFFAVASITNVSYAKSKVDRQVDNLTESTKIMFIDGNPDSLVYENYIDSIKNRISEFYYDQFRHFQDPQAPYFMFMSKDAQLGMGIGGTVRMRGYYDWGGAMPSPGFMPYLIPIQPDYTNMRQLGTTPAGTALFFRGFGTNKLIGEYQFYIEANFNGYKARDFHLKKAYAIIKDFTFGYAPSTFSDPAAQPPVVDAQGATNKITPTSLLVRYMPVVKNHWVFAVSAEMPSTQIDADNTKTSAVTTWLPDVAAFVQYQWTKGQHVRLSAVARTLPYRDLVLSKNFNPVGWGLQLSSIAHPEESLTTYVTLNYGHGYAGLGGDLQAGNYDLVANPELPGRLYAPAVFGWCVGLQYNFTPSLFVSASASQTRYLPSKQISSDEYKYGIFACANIFWNITPRLQVGAEYDFGKRQNFSGAHRFAQRAGLMAQLSF